MSRVRIEASTLGVEGQVFIMADPEKSHPEVPLLQNVDDAPYLVVIVHPADEQRIRDAVAIEQERPGWWRDLQRLERAMRAAAKGAP